MHFAEEPIIRGGDDEEDENEEDDEDAERSDEDSRTPPFPAEKQRLIRKDTPHYKKHFKITKLPKPETVAALLQGYSHDGLSPTAHTPEDERDGDVEEEEEDEEEEGGVIVNTPFQHRLETAEFEDSRLSQMNSSLQPVKVRRAHFLRGWWGKAWLPHWKCIDRLLVKSVYFVYAVWGV